MERCWDLFHAVVVAVAPTVVSHLLKREESESIEPDEPEPKTDSFKAFVARKRRMRK